MATKHSRSYVADLPGGTATTSIQIQGKSTLKTLAISVLGAAAGKVEVSESAATQIGTAQPTSDVIARFSLGASTFLDLVLPINVPVAAFQTIYVHQTGAANLGTVVLS